jgi:hypothetical protein
MSRRYASYYPLVLALLFGLAISLIPISPALGDNIAACQGSTNLSTRLILGGRTITPGLLLQAAGGQTCPAGEAALNLVSLSHTIIVSPKGTPIQNGAALLAARNIISNANPSASNPWLLKLEPGNYDLNGGSLTLLPYVDLEGSGEDTTVISSTVSTPNYPPATGTFLAASNSEVRFLTVANTGPELFQIAVYVPTGTINARFTHLTTIARGGYNNVGFANNGGTVIVQNSTHNAFSNSPGVAAGLFDDNGTTVLIDNILTASGGPGKNYGLYHTSGIITVTNSTSTAFGGSSTTAGLFNSAGTATIQNSTFTASNGSGTNAGVYILSGSVTVQNSVLSASGNPGSANYGLTSSGSARIAATQLSSSGAPSFGLTICPLSYNGNFQPLNPTTCQ